MRCAVSYNENEPLTLQEVKAWSELQSLSEEPAYRESDIKDDKGKQFFYGYKCALDDLKTVLENLEFDGALKRKKKELILDWMDGNLFDALVSILDDQFEDDEAGER